MEQTDDSPGQKLEKLAGQLTADVAARVGFAKRRISLLSRKRGYVLGLYAWQCVAWPLADFREWFAREIKGLEESVVAVLYELHCSIVQEGYQVGNHLRQDEELRAAA